MTYTINIHCIVPSIDYVYASTDKFKTIVSNVSEHDHGGYTADFSFSSLEHLKTFLLKSYNLPSRLLPEFLETVIVK